MPAGHLVIVSGPSGCGKSTLIGKARARMPAFRFPVSATTRPPRPGEQDGREYHFLAMPDFEAKIAAGEFLEHALVYDKRYGTLKATVLEGLARGELFLKDIDVQGARAVMAALPPASLTSIFVSPPSLDELARRLAGRGTEDRAVLERRLREAEAEMAAAHLFGHVVVNGDLAAAEREFLAILRPLAAARPAPPG